MRLPPASDATYRLVARERQVRELRCALFTRGLAAAVECRHSGCAFARWYEARHNLPRSKSRNKRWIAFFNATLPGAALQQELLASFPQLGVVFDDSLWVGFADDPKRLVDWDGLAESVERSYALHGLTDLAVLMRCPEIEWLGRLLILMRAKQTRFLLTRFFLSLRISRFVLMSCVSPPGCWVAQRLYERISSLIQAKVFSVEIEDWPATFLEFDSRLSELRTCLNIIVDHGWVRKLHPDALLFYILLCGLPRERRAAFLEHVCVGDEGRAPRWMLQRFWRAQNLCRRWQKMHTAPNGIGSRDKVFPRIGSRSRF